MTNYERPSQRPEIGAFYGFHHIRFYVTNAKQAATYYITRFGFQPHAYSGLETGSTSECIQVVKNGDVLFVLCSALNPDPTHPIVQHVANHSDGVKDVAFSVDDTRGIYEKAIARGAESVKAPEELKDEHGSVLTASIKTYGETIHTFVQNVDYTGPFLPGFKRITVPDPISALLPEVKLEFVDHVVGNQPENEMTPTADWYNRVLDFHRYWSVDDSQLHTEFSSLRSIVMVDYDEVVKMPINEPAPGKRKSQIQEYVDYYGGAGVQHIALRTEGILSTIAAMRKRGAEFLEIPEGYYKTLRNRLEHSPCRVTEDLTLIEELNILVDFDDQGYLLQIFTKPIEDRPTLFLEFIQRRNNNGFGVGNFKALFEALELEQEKRGNLK